MPDPTDAELLDEQAASLGVPTVPVRRERFETEAGVISALAYGSDPAAVTLLHGAGLNAHTWDATVLALASPALALDLPGHGDSAWRQDADYAPSTIGIATADVIEQGTTRPQVLVGHSLGGLTATWIAAHRPHLVSALIIIDITPDIDESAGLAALRAFYEVTDFPSREAVVEHAAAFGLGGDRAALQRAVTANTRVRADGRVVWKHHFAQLAAATLRSPSVSTGWADLAATTVPITLVRASEGFLSPAARDRFIDAVPQARIIELAGPHNLQETAPGELATIINDVAQQR